MPSGERCRVSYTVFDAMSCIRRARVPVPCAELALRSARTDGLGDRFTVQPFTPTATGGSSCNDAQRRPDVRRHATLPPSWIQRENWEFETHRRAGGAVGRDAWTGGTTPGGQDPLTATPTAGPRRAIPPPQPHTRHTAAQSRPHRHGGRQWPEPGALACDGGRRRPERRSPPTVPALRRGFGTSGRSRPHVCAGPADEANRQDPHLPMREWVGTPAA